MATRWSNQMNDPKSLQRRIRVSYYLLTTFICLIFTSIFLSTEERIEQTILYGQLSKQIDHAIDEHLEWFSEDNSEGVFRFYKGENLPAFISHLPHDGLVHEVIIDGVTLAILTKVKGGIQYTVTSNPHQIEAIETTVLIFLLTASSLGLLVSFFFSKFIVQSTIRPLKELAQTVSSGTLASSSLITLEDEIGFLAKVILNQDHQLNMFLDREQKFASDVSHELRTPLAIILGATEVLETQLSDNPKAIHHLSRIHRTTQDAANLVGVLLLLARSPDKIDAPRTNIAALVEEEIEHYSYLLLKKQVSCQQHIKEASHVFVRPELARVAFGNLIRNAFQHTEQGCVTVVMNSSEMYVENTGESIPPSVQAALFEPYNRGQNPSSTGLGLSIVERICQHTGWQIHYDNLPTGGSRFTLVFTEK